MEYENVMLLLYLKRKRNGIQFEEKKKLEKTPALNQLTMENLQNETEFEFEWSF